MCNISLFPMHEHDCSVETPHQKFVKEFKANSNIDYFNQKVIAAYGKYFTGYENEEFSLEEKMEHKGEYIRQNYYFTYAFRIIHSPLKITRKGKIYKYVNDRLVAMSEHDYTNKRIERIVSIGGGLTVEYYKTPPTEEWSYCYSDIKIDFENWRICNVLVEGSTSDCDTKSFETYIPFTSDQYNEFLGTRLDVDLGRVIYGTKI